VPGIIRGPARASQPAPFLFATRAARAPRALPGL
jgi:hypothetical protein